MRFVAFTLGWLAARCASTVGGAGDGDARADPGDAGAARAAVLFDARAHEIFRDPPCPLPRPAPRRRYECDPLRRLGCPVREACYVYVDPPPERCDVETYRARCFAAGVRVSGQFCASGTDCAAGLNCFVTGAMNRCLRLCRLDGGGEPCARGSVCQPTELPDFGACD